MTNNKKLFFVTLIILILLPNLVSAVSFTFGGDYNNFYTIFTATNGGTTFSSNLASSTNWDYFSDSPQINDAIYFRFSRALKGIKLYVGTPLNGTDVVLKWEYYGVNGNGVRGWYELEVYNDTTNNLTNIGEGFVEFMTYHGLYEYYVNGVRGLWIRLRLINFTNISEGGNQSTQTAQYDQYYLYPTNSTADSPYTLEDVKTYMDTNYPHWPVTRNGNQYVLDFLIDNRGQYLKTQNEYLVIGNGNEGDFIYWGNLLAGTKDASGMTKNGSTIYMRVGGSCGGTVNFNSNAKVYDSRMTLGTYWGWYYDDQSKNSYMPCSGGYFGINTGEFQDTTLEGGNGQGYNNNPIFRNVLFHTNIWIMSGGTPTFDDVSISKPEGTFGGFYTYNGGFTLKNFKYGEFSRLFYLYQTYTDIIINVINPSPALSDLSSSPYTIQRQKYTLTDIRSVQNYDNTSGFTDQTAEARDDTADDVSLTGKTGDPEVGDAIYFKIRDSSEYSWNWGLVLNVTMGSTVNTDNIYTWERYASGGWVELIPNEDIWDLTKSGNYSFAHSGKIYIRRWAGTPYYTDINGVNGAWIRARITTAGSSKPVASKIQQTSRMDTGISNWRLYEKYTFNLKVIDRNNNPISGATITLKDKDDTEMFSVTTGPNGTIEEQEVIVKTFKFDPANGEYQEMVCNNRNPMKILIFHQDYPPKEFKFILDKKIDWTIALGDRPKGSGIINVYGTEYSSGEEGIVYAQVLYGDGTPANNASCNVTIWNKEDIFVSNKQMTHIANSRGVYYYNFTTPSEFSVYIADVICENPSAYGSAEIHVRNITTFGGSNITLTEIYNLTKETYNQTKEIYSFNIKNIMNPSFVLWLVLLFAGTFLILLGISRKKVSFLIISTILYMVSAFYSFNFTDIIGDAGVWVMIGLSMIGLVVSFIYTLYATVSITKQKSLEGEW